MYHYVIAVYRLSGWYLLPCPLYGLTKWCEHKTFTPRRAFVSDIIHKS